MLNCNCKDKQFAGISTSRGINSDYCGVGTLAEKKQTYKEVLADYYYDSAMSYLVMRNSDLYSSVKRILVC